MNKKKVILGLSGGVDSSVAAALLLKEGYDVEAVFMRNWDEAANNDLKGNPNLYDDMCQAEKDYIDAKRVAEQLNIKLHRVDFVEDYWNEVFTYFLDEYKKDRTPNPDILCNNEIKFKRFVDYATQFNYDYVAMGHYARKEIINGRPALLKGIDENKDQSYFLSQLTEEQIEKVLFPLGNIDKKEVRKIAKELNLYTAFKKDSTGICFIGERNFGEFLSNYLPAQPGKMKRLNGEEIKDHDGLMYYTIGQRKGLGIGGSEVSLDAWYVVGKDLKTNTLFVEPDKNHPHLFSNRAIITDVKWRGDKIDGKMNAKFRYRQKDQPVSVKWLDNETIEVQYSNVKAVTPGQACAFYLDDVCLGSGFISEVFYNNDKRMYA